MLSLKQVAKRLGVCERSIRRYIALGELPRPVRVGPKLVKLLECDVEAYLQRIQGQRQI